MSNSIHKICEAITSRPSAVSSVSYFLVLAFLLYTSCPLVFAVFLALPVALMIGLPIMLLAGLVLLGSELGTFIKEMYQDFRYHYLH